MRLLVTSQHLVSLKWMRMETFIWSTVLLWILLVNMWYEYFMPPNRIIGAYPIYLSVCLMKI